MTETLVDLANCCRCCLRGFNSEETAVAIDETLRNNFYEITGKIVNTIFREKLIKLIF